MDTLRVFVKWAESVDAVKRDLHTKVRSPVLRDGQNVRDVMFDSERAEEVLGHLSKYEYASRPHIVITLMWHTMMWTGAVHSLDVDGSEVDQAMKQMLASLLGDLAKIEHKQKLRRIRSGISAAQDAGKWTGRLPTGFEVDDDSRLRVDVETFLRLRAGIERVAAGEERASVADDICVAPSTDIAVFNPLQPFSHVLQHLMST